jgi:hypothetical protein
VGGSGGSRGSGEGGFVFSDFGRCEGGPLLEGFLSFFFCLRLDFPYIKK